ncbi:MAG: hypothetical protein ABJE10_00245 [bacterium]
MAHVRSLAVVFALLSLACSRATTETRDVSAGQNVQLGVGESATVTPGAVRVQFAAVNDSRCPSDVVCIQAGDAMIILALSGAGADRTDTLYLVRQPRSVSYGGYRFDAVNVQPYPRTTDQSPAKTLELHVATAP